MTQENTHDEPAIRGLQYERTGRQVVGAEGDLVDEIQISGVNHVSVSATVAIDAPLREARKQLGYADGATLETEVKGADY